MKSYEFWAKLRFRRALAHCRRQAAGNWERKAITQIMYDNELLEEFMVRCLEIPALAAAPGDWVDEIGKLIQMLLENLPSIIALILEIIDAFTSDPVVFGNDGRSTGDEGQVVGALFPSKVEMTLNIGDIPKIPDPSPKAVWLGAAAISALRMLDPPQAIEAANEIKKAYEELKTRGNHPLR
jgi:hypothetical protein